MPTKRKEKENDTKAKLFGLLDQANELVKSFEGQALEKAKSFIPLVTESKLLENEKVRAGLKKLGLATRSELDELQQRLETLESSVNAGKSERTIRSVPTGNDGPSAT